MYNFTSYLQSLQKFPEPVQDFFSGSYLSLQMELIEKQYNLKSDEIDNILNELVVRGLKINDLKQLIDEKINASQSIKKELFIDLCGKLFLPIDEHLNWNIPQVFSNNGIDISSYENYLKDYQFTQETERLSEFMDAIRERMESLNINEMVADILESYGRNLVVELKETDVELTQTINLQTIMLLYGVKSFHDDVIKAMLANQEVLTSALFVLEGKQSRPTIENWFKDFFQEQGGGAFDALALAKYLTTSANVRRLNQADSELVRKLLKTYSNLVNYKKIFANQPPEQWQIIPIERTGDVFEELSRPNVKSPARHTTINLKEKVATDSQMSKSALDRDKPHFTEATRDKRQAELMALANTYEVGSLERRAVEEEIKRNS